MNQALAFRMGAALGFLAVTLGAFGAHSLAGTLNRFGTVAIWEKAVFYHIIHALAILILARSRPWHRGPVMCFLGGIVIFSGSLYLLAATNTRWLGAITPLGGLSFLAGWGWLVIGGAGKSES